MKSRVSRVSDPGQHLSRRKIRTPGSSPLVGFRERRLHALSRPQTEERQSGAGSGVWQQTGVRAGGRTTPACTTWSRPPRSVSAASPARRSCSPAASLWSPPPCYCWWGCCRCWKWTPSLRRWSWAWWGSFGARWRCPSLRPSWPAQNGPASGPAAWQGLESCGGPGCDTPAASGCGSRLPAVAQLGTGHAAPLAFGRTGPSSCTGAGYRIHLREARKESGQDHRVRFWVSFPLMKLIFCLSHNTANYGSLMWKFGVYLFICSIVLCNEHLSLLSQHSLINSQRTQAIPIKLIYIYIYIVGVFFVLSILKIEGRDPLTNTQNGLCQ